MNCICFDTPAGPLALEAEGEALTALYLPNQWKRPLQEHSTPLLEEAKRQLLAYFRKELRTFSLPLAPQGTEFQRRVWAQLERIPYGTVISYRELAQRAECPQGYQAVGQANRCNPLPILIPCHRVIGADGSLGGYAGGLELKQYLLRLEGSNYGEK